VHDGVLVDPVEHDVATVALEGGANQLDSVENPLVLLGGVEGGVALAESLPEHALRKLFGVLMILIAAQIAWRAYRRR
jgi:hypothetical protein